MIMTLKDLKPGEKGVIQDIQLPHQAKLRFMVMGILKGSIVEVINFAFMGDPIVIGIAEQRLAIRKKEAAGIIVEKVV